MPPVIASLLGFWWVLPIVAALIGYKLVLRLFGIVVISENQVGVVNKSFVLFGKNRVLPDGKIIALNGEAGYQADTLGPGMHLFYWPWQYAVERVGFVTIPQNQLGIVESRDGVALSAGRILARRVDCDTFQDARKFLMNGGERGAQMTIIPPGTYRVNTALFTVKLAPATDIPDNMVGVVTTREGSPLPSGEIAGSEVTGHNLFQDAQAFIDRGGFKGMQTQVMLSGRYFVNPLFATVEIVSLQEIPIGHVGVVISYVGQEGSDQTGEGFKHGNIVRKGEKGVWLDPLDPGKYPINPHTTKVELVPTTNIVLNWATGKNESHALDKHLCTITVRSGDGFTFNLDVSQIIHVPRTSASKVIARFGNMANLVTQVLEPTIGNYFRNAAQTSDVIQFLQARAERQKQAKEHISKALSEYDVQAVDTLIGDIVPPDSLMKTLTDRKLAHEQQATFDTQVLAENKRLELNKSKAQADIQPQVVEAERSVEISKSRAEAAVQTAKGEADSKRVRAEADAAAQTIIGEAAAKVTKLTGDAEASKTLAIGNAEAEAMRNKIASVGAENFATIEVGRALASNKIKLVPDITVSGNGQGGNGLVDVLLANLIRPQLGELVQGEALHSVPSVDEVKQAVLNELAKTARLDRPDPKQK
jgi:uncharacterized membrane protein YqiK